MQSGLVAGDERCERGVVFLPTRGGLGAHVAGRQTAQLMLAEVTLMPDWQAIRSARDSVPKGKEYRAGSESKLGESTNGIGLAFILKHRADRGLHNLSHRVTRKGIEDQKLCGQFIGRQELSSPITQAN